MLVGASVAYVPGDHESGLGRDIVLAPPTCCSCCCCCCCTLAAPEIYGGTKFARDTAEAYEARGALASFWDVQLSFASGALLFSIAASPIAALVGVPLLADGGSAAPLIMGAILVALVIGVLVQTTRLGALHGDESGPGGLAGFGWGIVVLALIAAAITGEIALVVLVTSAEPLAALIVAGAALVIGPIVAAGWKRRRDARDLATEAAR